MAIKTHGMTRTPEYTTWVSMKNRCYNSNHENYHRYGGRGITVCDRWKDSFENFLQDMGNKPLPDHSIDREDNDGNYEPGNCKWSTAEEQAYNRSTNITVTSSDGQEYNTKEAKDKFGLTKGGLHSRLNRGIPIDKPVQKYNTLYPYKDNEYTSLELSELSGVPVKLLRVRLTEGWDVERAVSTEINLPDKYLYKDGFYSIPQIAKLTGLDEHNLRRNLNKGNTIEEAIEIMEKFNKQYSYNGNTYTITELAKLFDCTHATINNRLKAGQTPEEAAVSILLSKEIAKYEYSGEYLTINQLVKLTGYQPKALRRHLGRGLSVIQAMAVIDKNKALKTNV